MDDRFETLNVEVRDRIAFVTINRPDRLNALNAQMAEELPGMLRAFRAADDVDVAVVTGAGRAFSVGGDLEHINEINEDPTTWLPKMLRTAGDMVRAHIDLDKPIIAAVNGHALGGGAAFALLCDFIIMERSATLSDGHLGGGMAAGDGGALTWPLSVGLVKAKKYLYTADWITADEAERLGLISEVVDDGDALQRATEVAYRLVGAPQVALRFTKRSLNMWMAQALPIFDTALALEAITMARPEIQEMIEVVRTSKSTLMPPDPRRA